MGKKLLICGDRWLKERASIREALLLCWDRGYSILVHGACHLGGADIIAAEEAQEIGYEVRSYPAKWKRYGKAAGVIRNQQMLDEEHPDKSGVKISLCLGFHPNIEKSTGTKDMLARSRKAKIRTELVVDTLDMWNLYDC